jgi:hypothetical protein
VDSPAHFCPSVRTLRAEQLHLVQADAEDVRLSVYERRRAADRAAGTAEYMTDHQLCEDCGYPLDNSAPHPAAGRAEAGYRPRGAPVIARVRAWLREFRRGWFEDVVHQEDLPTARERAGRPYEEGE